MNVVRFHEYGSADVLKLEHIDMPVPGAGEILVRVDYASVNYSDVMRRANLPYPFPTPLPFIPGGEVSGTVEALGVGVDGPPVGTPVFGLSGERGYAQFITIPASQVIPIPTGMEPATAAALPIVGATAMLILREVGQLRAGETVLIPGAAGGVGGLAVQLARRMGAGCVIGATSSEDKAQLARALGAHHTVDYTQADWSDQVRALTGGRGVDLFLEMSGGPVFAQGLNCLAPFGRVIVYGTSSGAPLTFDDAAIRRFFYNPSLNQSVHSFNLGLWFGMRPEATGKAIGDMLEAVATGSVKLEVTEQLPLSQAAHAHRLIETRATTGKIVLMPWAE